MLSRPEKEGPQKRDVLVPLQCERGDSNPQGRSHEILSLARLPVPPLSRDFRYDKKDNGVRPEGSTTLDASVAGP